MYKVRTFEDIDFPKIPVEHDVPSLVSNTEARRMTIGPQISSHIGYPKLEGTT